VSRNDLEAFIAITYMRGLSGFWNMELLRMAEIMWFDIL
jgi:hypothetical protein